MEEKKKADYSQRQSFLDDLIKSKIYPAIYNLVNAALEVATKGTTELEEEAIKFAVKNNNNFDAETYKKLYKPVHWKLVNGEGEKENLINILSIGGRKHGFTGASFFKIKDSLDINYELVDELTTKIINSHKEMLLCKYLGVQRLDDYWQKLTEK